MISIVGIILTFVCVFGFYALSGGTFHVILHAVVFEGGTILGAAIGAFLLANTGHVTKATVKDLKLAFASQPWNKQDYIDLLLMMFFLCKTIRTKGMLAIESHLEKPEESELFNVNPKILHDHFALDFIVSTLRLFTMNLENPYQVEDLLDAQIEKHHHEALTSSHAIQAVADGMPAIGIVAAVLGVIKTMSSIDQPPVVLGGMIGGALVGTFLGVFLAYCFIAPISQKVAAYYDEQSKLYVVIKKIFVAHLHGYAPQVTCEIGRTNIPSEYQPSFTEIEEAQRTKK